MRFTLAPSILALLVIPVVACGDDSGSDNDPYAAERQACVDQINEYRASVGLPPYARWKEGEPCADKEAKSDSETGIAHGAFRSCTDAAEQESAQNECPGWPSVESTVTGCLEMMWNEGPGPWEGHGHYINMTSTSYSKVACGFYVTPSGQVWAVQNFR